METSMALIVISNLLLLFSASSDAQTTKAPSPTPTPAPAPAPEYVNLMDLLTVAGPFSIFLSYLESTKVIDTFQKQANNSDQGVTIFVPKDDAFKSLKSPSLSNLTQDQIKNLILFHGLPHFYTLADFKNLSQQNPITTFAGGLYTLNFTDVYGTVHISSGWTHTQISSSVHSTNPVSVFQIDAVLLPEAIFGTDIPPTPAPAPASEPVPAADSSSGVAGAKASAPAGSSSSHRITSWGMWSQFVTSSSFGVALFL